MDPAFLAKHVTGAVQLRKETTKAFLARASHVALQGLGLASLDGVEAASACHHLYAYDNRIASLGGLARLRKLEAAYLDGNDVASLLELAEAAAAAAAPGGEPSAAAPACSLERLFLKGNRVARVHAAAARALPHLRELHLPAQRLPPGAPCLALEPAALRAWAGCLRVLDVSGCGLPSLRHLAALRSLQELHAADNPVADLGDAVEAVRGLPSLRALTVRGCAFALPGAGGRPQGRYRDALVAASAPSLALLDGAEVTQAHRAFIATKMARSSARAASVAASAYRLLRASAEASLASAHGGSAAGSGSGSGSGSGGQQLQQHVWEDTPSGSEGGEGAGREAGEEGGGEGEEGEREAGEEEMGMGGMSREDEGSAGGGGGGGGGGGSANGSSLAHSIASMSETLTHEDAGAVRRASLGAGGGEAAAAAAAAVKPPLHRPPPLPTSASSSAVLRVGDASGFLSSINLPSNVYNAPYAHPGPARYPEDFARGSRWIGGYSTAADRERARMHFEQEREAAEVQRRRGMLDKRGKAFVGKK